jgi:Secretion system C-terminal sorting domain
VYANQSNSLGITLLKKEYNKFQKAINLFLVNFASSENQLGGTTLGYYTPINDWLVIRNDQVNSSSGTISHELGHHFSLPHPFKGWDQQACADVYANEWKSGLEFQVKILTAPDGITPVEFADKSNCKKAGDNICDTPAKKIKDPIGNYVDPQEDLFMGYFIGCAKYVFSPEQKALILADYLSAKRAKLRPNYTPNIVDVTGTANMVAPMAGSTTSFYNNITFDWDDVPGADRYILEIDKASGFDKAPIRFVEKTSMKVVTNLSPNVLKYYWRVIPFHSETGACTALSTIPKILFSTGAVSSAKDISGVSDWTISPNPVSNGTAIVVDVEVTQPFEAEVSLINSVGQKVQTLGNQQFTEGGNRLEIATKDISAGIYFVRLQTGKSITNKKVVVLN